MTLAPSRITDKLELDGICSQGGTFFFSFFFFFHEEEKSLRERSEISRTFPCSMPRFLPEKVRGELVLNNKKTLSFIAINSK